MAEQKKDRYDLEIPEEGLSYDILDLCFNPSTETFIASHSIRPGMRVLDAGSGSGIMTHYLSGLVGPGGHDAYKQTAFLHGQSEAQWLEQRQELVRLAEDDFSIVGFYQSCQVSGVK